MDGRWLAGPDMWAASPSPRRHRWLSGLQKDAILDADKAESRATPPWLEESERGKDYAASSHGLRRQSLIFVLLCPLCCAVKVFSKLVISS
jgi:hypothetical protein